MAHFVAGSFASSSAEEHRTTTTVADVKKKYPAHAAKLAALQDTAAVQLVVKRAAFSARQQSQCASMSSGERSATAEVVWVEDGDGNQIAIVENDAHNLVGSFPHTAQIRGAFADIRGPPKAIEQEPARPL